MDINDNLELNLVVSTLEDENDGDFSDGDLSLREAIAIAESGDIITFESNLNSGTISLDEGELLIDKSLSIHGLGANSLTIDANGSNRVFRIDDGNVAISSEVILDQLTITGGRDNNASEGGGNILNSETLTVQNTIISNGSSGGDDGGGGINNSGTINIFHSAILNNSAFQSGGAISNDATLNISNSTIDGNLSGDAGIIASPGAANISNSTITNNSANFGGSISSSGETVFITSSIVADNVQLNPLANSENRDLTGDAFVSGGNNLIGVSNDSNIFINGVNGDIVGTSGSPLNPQLGPLQNNGGLTPTRELLFASPAIDAGSNPDTLVTDQRGDGFNREIGSKTDIGAFEVQTIVDQNPDITPVVTTLDDENDGDLSAGDISLREAILLSNDADTITFDPNLSEGEITLILGDLDIDKNLTIQGLGANQLTINGAGNSRIFNIDDRNADNNINVVIDGLEITGGNATGEGEGEGGGIRNAENLVLSKSVVSNNSSFGNGGGISNTGNLEIFDSTIQNNSTPSVPDPRLGLSTGGGINNSGGTLNLSNSTVSGNTAGDGGGVNNLGTLNISNSTVSGNSSGFRGGGSAINGSANITSSIVAGNSGNDLSANIVSGGNNLIGKVEGISGFLENDLVGTADAPIDPLLGELQDNGGSTPTIALADGSPAIDAGSNPNALEFDQRGDGFARNVGAGTDIGAYEVQTPVSNPNSFVGTPGDDLLTGTNEDDTLQGLAGDDTLQGLDFADLLDGGDGNDSLEGGARNDRLFGGAGADTLIGGNGRDSLDGGIGNDSLDAGASDDFLGGGNGDDTLLGNTGRDSLDGGIGNDFLDGGTSDDLLLGDAGTDTLDGGNGRDTLNGGAGNDLLTGGNSNDTFVLTVGGGTDTITDFGRGNNVIGLADGLTIEDLSFTGSDILFGSETLATFNGFDPSSLAANNFVSV